MIKEVFYKTYKTYQTYQARKNPDRNVVKKWNKFRLIACDGTGFRVPDNAENRDKFGIHKNQYKALASCKMVVFHDVLNRIFIDVFLYKREASELTVVHQNFDVIPKDAVMIYDRAYGDSLLLARHLKARKHCIIRMKVRGSNIVKQFLDSGKADEIVTFQVGERSYKSAKKRYGLKNNFPKFWKFKIRLIRVILDNGEVEILATTLLNQKRYPHTEFKWLYGKRWGIETAFDEVKNQLKLGVFSGYNYQSVLQDIWAVFIFYNLRSLLIFESEQNLPKSIDPEIKRTPKSPKVQINRNIAIAVIRSHFFELFDAKTMNRALKWILNNLPKYLEPIRIRPPTERTKKVMRSNARHHTEKNYKPAL